MLTYRKIQITITVVAISIAVIHIIWPDLKIDSVTLTLIIISIVPWLAPLFKALELPGGIKFEFQELEKAKKEAEAAGLIDKAISKEQREYAFLDVAESNPELALAGLRIELEKVLRLLAEQNGIVSKNHAGIVLLMNDLHRKNIISNQERSALADMIGTLNRAVHGQELDHRVTQWVIETGPQILNGLNKRLLI